MLRLIKVKSAIEGREAFVQVLLSEHYSRFIELPKITDTQKDILKTKPNLISFDGDIVYAMVLTSGIPISSYGKSTVGLERLISIPNIVSKLENLEKETVIENDNDLFIIQQVGYSRKEVSQRHIFSLDLQLSSVPEDVRTLFRHRNKYREESRLRDLLESDEIDSEWYRAEGEQETHKKYVLVNSDAKLSEMLKEIESVDEVAIYTQSDKDWIDKNLTLTCSLYAYLDTPERRGTMTSLSISCGEDSGWFLPFKSIDSEVLNFREVMEKLYPLLKKKRLISFNGVHDWKIWYNMGYTLDIAEDVYILDFNIESDVFKRETEKMGAHPRTISYLSEFWTGDAVWGEKEILGILTAGDQRNLEHMANLNIELRKIHGCSYAEYTRRLYYLLREYLNPDQVDCYRLDVSIIEILGKSEFWGVNTDKSEILRRIPYYRQDVQNLENLMKQYIRDEGLKMYFKKEFFNYVKYNPEVKARFTRYNVPGVDGEYVDEDGLFEYVYETYLEPSSESIESKYNQYIEKFLDNPKLWGGKKLNTLVFDLLEYPKLSFDKEGKPRLDDSVRSKLISYKLEEPSNYFSKDLESTDPLATGKSKIVLKASELNKCRYPLALMLSKYNKYKKDLTTFYSQQTADVSSSYYYYQQKQSETHTARLNGGIHTIDGNNKVMICPFPQHYCCNADYSQIEVRFMAGEANKYWEEVFSPRMNLDRLAKRHRHGFTSYINKLNNPETDIHTETAANMLGIRAEEVTTDERHDCKKFTFGVPYSMQGLSLSAAAITEYVDYASEHANDLVSFIQADGNIGIAKWNFANFPIKLYLDRKREEGLTPVNLYEDGRAETHKAVKAYEEKNKSFNREVGVLPPYFDGRIVGYTANRFGRRKYVYLDLLEEWNADSRNAAKLKRDLGNFPIQSGARDQFFFNKLALYNAFKKKGWVSNPTDGSFPEMDKVILNVFVHDEFLSNESFDVHPYELIKTIYENCFTNLKEKDGKQYHPTYFMGVNFVNNWREGKYGVNELPVALVDYISRVPKEKYPIFKDGYFEINGKRIWIVDYFGQMRKQWVLKRVVSELKAVGVTAETTDWEKVANSISSYSVKSFAYECLDSFNVKADKEKGFAGIYEVIWNNRKTNFLEIDIECSRDWFNEVSPEEKFEDYKVRQFSGKISSMEESDEDEDEEDESSFFNDELGAFLAKRKADSEIDRNSEESKVLEYINEEAEVNYVLKERGTYEASNFSVKPLNPRMFIKMTGEVNLLIKKIPQKRLKEFVLKVKCKYGDPNGSVIFIVDYSNKVHQLPFRVDNIDREELSNIMYSFEE